MFQKPNSKTATNVAIQAGSMVVGAKIGDGLATLAPDSMNSYKRIALGIIGIALAASIPAKTTASTAAQSAALGMGVKQLYDEVTDALTDAVTVKGSDGATLTSTDKFVNALVGHKDKVPVAQVGVGAPWGNDLVDESIWERPTASLPAASFTGV